MAERLTSFLSPTNMGGEVSSFGPERGETERGIQILVALR
jgi:hypothetical protein